MMFAGTAPFDTAQYGQLRFTPTSVARVRLDIADALPLIFERAGGRAEVAIAAVLALIFIGRDWRCWRECYSDRTAARRHGCDHGIRREVDDRHRAVRIIRHVTALAVRCNG